MEIAIIAHDARKADMVAFLMSHLEVLKHPNINLIATGTTGSFVEEAGLKVTKFMSGPLGGDAQIAARVVDGLTNMVIFFKDPLGKQPHEPDINMLVRICDLHNIPIATNKSTAEILIESVEEMAEKSKKK